MRLPIFCSGMRSWADGCEASMSNERIDLLMRGNTILMKSSLDDIVDLIDKA